MALSFQDQLNVGIASITSGDMDLLSTMLLEPNSVTLDEMRTTSDKLGVTGSFQRWFVDTVTDPTVLVAWLLSRRYPTSSWLTGRVADRHIGSANDFTGVSMFTRPVENYFRGTNIPKLVGLSMRRHAEVMKVGKTMFDRFMNRPNWRNEKPIVSLLMEGQNPSGATPELRTLATTLRQDMDELWGFLRHAKDIDVGLYNETVSKARWRERSHTGAAQYLRDYLPHLPATYSNESVVALGGQEALRQLGKNQVWGMLKASGLTPETVWSVDKAGRLSSNFAKVQEFMNNGGDKIINPRLYQRTRHNLPIQSAMGQELFVADLDVVLQHYVNSVARSYANYAPLSKTERAISSSIIEHRDGSVGRIYPSEDPILVQVINEGIDSLGGNIVQRQVPGTPHVRSELTAGTGNYHMLSGLKTLVRAMRGDLSDDEILWGNLYSSARASFDRAAGRVLGRKQEATLDATLNSIQRSRDYRRHMNGIAGYFYATTLGLNPWTAMQNILQPAITTAPSIGIGPTLAGYRTLGKKVGDYMNAIARRHRMMRGNQSVGATGRLMSSVESAFEDTFPELAQAGMRIDPRLFEGTGEFLVNEGGRRVFRNVDDYLRATMLPFTQTEAANQIVSFYGSKEALRRAMRAGEWTPPTSLTTGKPVVGFELEEALNFEASMNVNATQFRPGPGSRTKFQSLLPAPFRQMTTFATRLFNYFTESTVRGAMTRAELGQSGLWAQVTGGRNLGPLSRTYLYGKIAANGAREVLGIDLTGALGVTAPFANTSPGLGVVPLPIPPLPTTIGGIVSFTATRDVKDLQPLELPGGYQVPIPKTLFPAGVSANRLFRAMNQWRPDVGGFVDENERLMWRGTSTDLIMSMLGIPLEKQRRARHDMERLHANRTAIRDFRRRFAVARLNGDYAEMDVLQQNYQKAFPDMAPLSVSDADLRRYREQSRITRVERMLQSMGSRSRYLQDHIYDHDPDLIAEPSPLSVLVNSL